MSAKHLGLYAFTVEVSEDQKQHFEEIMKKAEINCFFGILEFVSWNIVSCNNNVAQFLIYHLWWEEEGEENGTPETLEEIKEDLDERFQGFTVKNLHNVFNPS